MPGTLKKLSRDFLIRTGNIGKRSDRDMSNTSQACCGMPWNETEPMNERVKFIAWYLQHDEPFKALCERAGVSRKTGYKWVDRYNGGGADRPVR
jgi:transposase-like protein